MYDVMGPAEVFSRPTVATDNGREDRCYQVVTIGVSTEFCLTDSGVAVKPQVARWRAITKHYATRA